MQQPVATIIHSHQFEATFQRNETAITESTAVLVRKQNKEHPINVPDELFHHQVPSRMLLQFKVLGDNKMMKKCDCSLCNSGGRLIRVEGLSIASMDLTFLAGNSTDPAF
jgi:hypothetical protein